MTDQQFYRHALGVLQRESGPNGLARFLRLMRSGSGDYTHDRDRWLKRVTLGDVLQSVSAPDAYAQVASDEALLSDDGTCSGRAPAAMCERNLAGADLLLPALLRSDAINSMERFGEFTCPEPLPMPERLARVVPYQPI